MKISLSGGNDKVLSKDIFEKNGNKFGLKVKTGAKNKQKILSQLKVLQSSK